MKQIGIYKGMPLWEDPNAPPGQLYFVNENYMEFAQIDARSRWQRIKDWFKNKLRS